MQDRNQTGGQLAEEYQGEELEGYRAEIDWLDDEIFARLEKRAQLVSAIQAAKKSNGMESWDPERVGKIEARAARMAPGFSREQIHRLVGAIVAECMRAAGQA